MSSTFSLYFLAALLPQLPPQNTVAAGSEGEGSWWPEV